MTNSVTDGICIAINEEFGDAYSIYTEDIEQGLEEPCFFIRLLSHTSELYRDKRYYRTNQYAVQYFPPIEDEDKYHDCVDVLDRLYSCLEVIDLGVNGTTRASSMEGEFTSDMLTLIVSYDMFVDKQPDSVENMETYTLTQRGKNG